MKRIVLAFFAVFAVGSIFAAPLFRVDVSGLDMENKVKVAPGRSRTMRFHEARWRPEADRPFSLVAMANSALKDKEWKTYTFGIRAENAGPILLALGGEWAQEVEDREWVVIGEIKIGDKTVDFGAIKKNGNNFVLPEGFALVKDAEVIGDGGVGGKPGVLCNHDSRLNYIFQAEAGKTYEISVTVKAE